MLRWISINTLKNRIKNENKRDKLRVATIEDKTRDLRWPDMYIGGL